MALQKNLKAPNLPLELPKDVARTIADMRGDRHLCPYAAKDSEALRRDASASLCDIVRRPSYVRDAETIIHLPAYNRLSGKTQVFSFHANDDISRRGLHVQLVSRVARDIGYALGLNLNLIEAISLGHDIGHTPFGHAGEQFLDKVYREHTGRRFFHNVQSVRVLDVLYGRNFSLQMLDGVLCHNGEYGDQVFKTSNLSSFSGTDGFDAIIEQCWATGDGSVGQLRPMTLEGCVLRIADIIAYVGKDRQDAVAAGLVDEDVFADGMGGAYNAWALAAFVTDIISHSLNRSHIAMSEEGFCELARAKKENYQLIYRSSELKGEAMELIEELFSLIYDCLYDDLVAGRQESPIFQHHIAVLMRQLSYYKKCYDWQNSRHLTVVDYLSSMTDHYFIDLAHKLFPEVEKRLPSRRHFARHS